MRMTHNIKSIHRFDLENRIRHSPLFTNPDATADEYLAQIGTITMDILYKIAPLRSIRCHGLSSSRKLFPEAMAAKHEWWRPERKWKITDPDDDKHWYRDSCKIANDLINKSRSDQHYSKIENCKNDRRRKCSAIREILHPPTILSLTMLDDENVMSQQLADFFHEKVANIQSAISCRLGGSVPDPMKADIVYHGIPLNNLMTVTETEVQRSRSSMNGKTSSWDSIPMMLMKECSSTFSFIVDRLANLSFFEGVFPSAFKCAQITPIVRKAGLDRS